jgi:hypothetical protein
MAELNLAGSVFQRVPMTPGIDALPKVGDMPVPWITEFVAAGVEDPKYPNFAAHGGLAIDCSCRLGVGRPKIGTQCVKRQRAAMLHRRCNICGKHIDGEAIFVGVAGIGGVNGPPIRYSVEAPSHPTCAAYSALTCPRLSASPRRCLIAVVPGEYPIYDRWVIADNDTKLVAHGEPRYQIQGKWIGALDMHITALDPKTVVLTLQEWMTGWAPSQYRELWPDITRSGTASRG